MGYFSPINIAILLIDLALAWHVIRSGRSPLWIMGMGLASFVSMLALFALWLAYLVMAVVPDLWNSNGMRRLTGSVMQAADPGRGYREKKRQVDLVGSVDAKRALAEESLKQGHHDEAIALYQSAMPATQPPSTRMLNWITPVRWRCKARMTKRWRNMKKWWRAIPARKPAPASGFCWRRWASRIARRGCSRKSWRP